MCEYHWTIDYVLDQTHMQIILWADRIQERHRQESRAYAPKADASTPPSKDKPAVMDLAQFAKHSGIPIGPPPKKKEQ